MKTRKCPICSSNKSNSLFNQRFANNLSHNIALCINCGFVFVNNASGQKEYNEYYKNMSKYECERDNVLHLKYRTMIKKYAKKTMKIMDIGCSTGHLLYLLKKFGYKDLVGIDPSPKCKEIALVKHKIRVETSNFFSFKTNEKYDFIILTAVLEHLEQVKNAIIKIDSMLSENGYIFITVPDAEKFSLDFEEPFGEFSFEHINFFSAASLYQLMKNYTCCMLKSDNKVIYSLWRKGGSLEKSITGYISKSNKKLKNLEEIINKCPSKVVVWGAGSLTQCLLQTTNLGSKVIKFVDMNNNIIGERLNDIEIISPNELYKYKEPILISSFRFKDEIKDAIMSKNLVNNIITF